MAAGKFTLADRLGAKSVPCRVSGCSRSWIQLSNKAFGLAGSDAPAAGDPTEGMCDPCREKFRTIKDALRPCDRKGCAGKWTWPVMDQLEAFAAQRPAPKHLCADCQQLLDSLQDKEIPCAVPGCTRSAILSREQQLVSQGETAESTAPVAPNGVTFTGYMCEPCTQVARKLKDRAVSCGVFACSRKWTWKADEQIQAFAAGKPNEPPRRMCAECRTEFGKLFDREIRCRTSGCKATWTWPRSDQLDACVADKPVPKAPSRMCQRCFDLWSSLKDVDRPCRRSGCKGTWSDKRGAQLARLVRGKSADPYPRYCGECEKELGDLDDREIACRTDGCPGTWTWSKEQQLAAGVRPKLKEPPPLATTPVAPALAPAENGESAPAPEAAAVVASETPTVANAAALVAETSPTPSASAPSAPSPGKGKKNRRRREPQPPERRCSACAEFLAGRKTQEIPCIQCGTPIYWPPESQLQTHLGNWAAPALCGACKLAQVTAARDAAREALRHPHLAPPPESPAPPPATPGTDNNGA